MVRTKEQRKKEKTDNGNRRFIVSAHDNARPLSCQPQVCASPYMEATLRFGFSVMIFQLKRKPGWSLTDARQYWLEVHGPIVTKLPGLRRYVQSHLVDAAYAYAEPKWDGVAQLWVDDATALQKLLDSKEFKEGAWPDGEKFLDLSIARSLVAQEHRVI